jgi:genome maintenance exonuclease 1
MFNYVKLPELDFELKSETTNKGRTYVTPNGDVYPSVTTVLSPYSKEAILSWRKRVGEEVANKISTQASSRGTKLHSVCESYLLNEIPKEHMQMIMPDTKELFFKIKSHLDTNIGTIYSIERPLFSDKLKIAGKADCIAEWNGELSVIDFKTSSKEKQESYILNYFMQATAYAEMFEEMTGKTINQIVLVFALVEGGSQVIIKQKHDYLKPLTEYIDFYWSGINEEVA